MGITTKKLIFGDCPIDAEKYEEIRDELQKFGMTQNQVKVFFYLGKFKYAPGTLASLATLLLWFYFVPGNYLIRLDIILLLISLINFDVRS